MGLRLSTLNSDQSCLPMEGIRGQARSQNHGAFQNLVQVPEPGLDKKLLVRIWHQNTSNPMKSSKEWASDLPP